MILAKNDPEAPRVQLLERVSHALQGYAAKGHVFSMETAVMEINDLPTEQVECVLRILEDGTYYDGVELISDICALWHRHRIPAIMKLHQQLNEMNHYPDAHIGFRQCRYHLDALVSYGTDVSIPSHPVTGEAFHPVHLALLIVTDAMYVLSEIDFDFDANGDEPFERMGEKAYRLNDDALVEHLTSNPEQGERTARLVFSLKTLRFDALRPFVDLMAERPEDESRIIELLENGHARDTEIRELLAGRTIPALAAGVL